MDPKPTVKKKKETRYMYDFKENKDRFMIHSFKKGTSLQKMIDAALLEKYPELFKS